ncbi:MAG: hypothetical protein QW279_01530 [Candidatus Jordarchaeaceae archaeon]
MMLSEVVFNKWFWTIALSVFLIIFLPLAIIWFILNLPPILRIFATIAIVILWGVVSGYKDWLIAKRKEEEKTAEKSS